MPGRTVHENLQHILEWFGAEGLADLPARVYAETECGATIWFRPRPGDPCDAWIAPGDWIEIDGDPPAAIRFHTIVEGSDAEFTTPTLAFPIADADLRAALAALEAAADEAWNEANPEWIERGDDPPPPTPAQVRAYVDGKGQRCPFCGHDVLEGDNVEIDGGVAWQPMQCNRCNAEWNDIYYLAAVGHRYNAGGNYDVVEPAPAAPDEDTADG